MRNVEYGKIMYPVAGSWVRWFCSEKPSHPDITTGVKESILGCIKKPVCSHCGAAMMPVCLLVDKE